MADLLVLAVRGGQLPHSVRDLFLTDIPEEWSNLDGVMVSGGVGEYVAGREARDFGDLGIHLGQALRKKALAGEMGATLLPAHACMPRKLIH